MSDIPSLSVTNSISGNSTYGKVTDLSAVVATAVRTTVETQRGTVSLNVTKSLAVVTLLG